MSILLRAKFENNNLLKLLELAVCVAVEVLVDNNIIILYSNISIECY